MERIGPIFKNPANQAFFNKMGFVKIPLLDVDQVSALLQCYEQVKDAHEAINIPFITTSHSNNADLIGKVNQEILNIVENSILEEISNGEIIFSNFLIKKSGEKSESNPHQDLSIVDEQKFFSFSVWIALSNNNPLNGAMRFLAKSHLLKPSIRVNSHHYWEYEKVMQTIKMHMLSCSSKAGEAFIFPHNLIHGSYPNLSKNDRLACVVSMVPKGADLINYFIKEDRPEELLEYEMSKEAFINYIKGEAPHLGKLKKSTVFQYPLIEEEAFLLDLHKLSQN